VSILAPTATINHARPRYPQANCSGHITSALVDPSIAFIGRGNRDASSVMSLALNLHSFVQLALLSVIARARHHIGTVSVGPAAHAHFW
jgi:hypothetical protein